MALCAPSDGVLRVAPTAAIGGGVLLVAGFLAAPLIVPVLMASATIVGAGIVGPKSGFLSYVSF